jgi:YVTN family beta-propeller protein
LFTKSHKKINTTMNSIKKTLTFTLLFGAAVGGAFAQQKTGFKVLANHPIHSSGGWDYILVDGAAKRVYVSHGNQVNVISTSGDSIGVIPKTTGVHGIAIVKDLGKGYTSNGRANSLTVFDLKTLATISEVTIPAQNPDAIFYDTFSKKIYTCNGRSKDMTVLDPATDKVVATIPLGDKLETAVSDGKGKIYVNGENTSSVFVVDATTFKQIGTYKIDGGTSPSGLDIDTKTNRLFIACADSKTMVVMNAANGKTIAKFPIGDSDGLVFDTTLKVAYASNGEGTISAVRELSADKFEFVENITTEPSARTIGIDQLTHHLYLQAAKTEPATGGGRPKQIPGTFHVIEVGK